MKIKTLFLASLLLLVGHGAYAAPLLFQQGVSPTAPHMNFGGGGDAVARYNEVGDAGDTVGTAQDVTDGTTQIFGSNTANDVDLFAFSWGGGVLTIDTFGTAFDTQLHLFDALGNGIGESDDAVGIFAGPSEISLDLAAGIFLIAITGFNNDAVDAALNPVFGFTNTFNDLNGNFIQGPEGNGPLAGWDDGDFGSGGDYVINFSAAVDAPGGGPMPTPEPGMLLLLGLGLAGFGFSRRRN